MLKTLSALLQVSIGVELTHSTSRRTPDDRVLDPDGDADRRHGHHEVDDQKRDIDTRRVSEAIVELGQTLSEAATCKDRLGRRSEPAQSSTARSPRAIH